MRYLSLVIFSLSFVNTKTILATTPIENCHKEINQLSEHGKSIAEKKGLKGIIDKAQIGSLRALGDKSTFDACIKTRDKLLKFIASLKKSMSDSKKD